MWCDLVRCWFSSQRRFRLAGVVHTPAEAVERVRAGKVRLVLLDLRWPEARDGLECLRALLAAAPVRVLVISEDAQPYEVADVVRSGARGMLCKRRDGVMELAWALERLDGGMDSYTAAIAVALAEHVRTMRAMRVELAPMEAKLLRLLNEGCTLKEACGALGINPGSASSYMGRAKRKMGVPATWRSTQVAKAALERGLLDLIR